MKLFSDKEIGIPFLAPFINTRFASFIYALSQKLAAKVPEQELMQIVKELLTQAEIDQQ